MKKSLKSWLSAVLISTNFFSSGTYYNKSNAVKLFLEDSTGSKREVFNFDITPDNPYFDENGKEIVKIFQDDTSLKAWYDSNQRYAVRTAIEQMIAKQIKDKLGSAKDWGTADDKKAKLFKILSIIVTECARILLRARKEGEYQSWLNAYETPQARLDLFWISWMTHNFILWFDKLYKNPEKVGIESCLAYTLSSTDYRRRWFKNSGEPLFWARGTLISRLLSPQKWKRYDYACYLHKYVSWCIKDKFLQNVQERWLHEKPTDKTLIDLAHFTSPYTYPVVGKKEDVSKQIAIDDFLNGDLLNLSCNNELTFKVLDDDNASSKKPTTSTSSKPVVNSVKHVIRLENQSASKSKSFEIDSDKDYKFKVSKTGTPTLEEID